MYEGSRTVITVGSPISTTIRNITFTFNGVPHTAIAGLSFQPIMLDVRFTDLIINNIPASLNGNTVGCIAELSTGATVTCAPIQTLQVQGMGSCS